MKIFMVFHPLIKINKFIMFEKMIPGKKYHFLVSNTDRSNQGGMHC